MLFRVSNSFWLLIALIFLSLKPESICSSQSAKDKIKFIKGIIEENKDKPQIDVKFKDGKSFGTITFVKCLEIFSSQMSVIDRIVIKWSGKPEKVVNMTRSRVVLKEVGTIRLSGFTEDIVFESMVPGANYADNVLNIISPHYG